nr:hypothetical protein [uncultured Celeribacter sp.]
MAEAGKEQQPESGRGRVRRLLITPLEAGGMQRKRGRSVADHEKMLTRLADKLGYMSDRGLQGLAMYLVRMAGEGQIWPVENLILRTAWSMETPPPRDNAYLISLMKSRAGEAALEGGYVLELYAEARRLGPPPSRHQVLQLKDRAARNRDRARVIADQIKRNVAPATDRDWLEGYHRLRAEAEALVLEGKREREQGATS